MIVSIHQIHLAPNPSEDHGAAVIMETWLLCMPKLVN